MSDILTYIVEYGDPAATHGVLPRLYYNRYPEQHETESRAARQAGVVPIEVPGPAFEALAAEDVTMIYVVVGNRLLVPRRRARGEHISHAVLASSEPVQAAGEFETERNRGTITVTRLNNMSGHYRPDAGSLAVAREAFETRGFPVRPGSVHGHDLGAQ